MNVYQELLFTKIVEKLYPVSYMSNDKQENSDSNKQIIEQSLSPNSFTESFFEKVALMEFDASIYNNIACAKILSYYYQQIVYSELKQIRNKSHQIIVNPLIHQAINDSSLQPDVNIHIPNKRLSLTILDFGNTIIIFL